MGIFDHIVVDEDVDLPHFPEDWPRDLGWQTKSLQRSLSTFGITPEGLLRKEQTYREKTEQEKNEMAQEYTDGEAQTWEEWKNIGEDKPLSPPLETWKRTVQEEWWVDHHQHGSVRFYTSSRGHDFLDGYVEYEARFTKGELDEVVLLSDKEVLQQ